MIEPQPDIGAYYDQFWGGADPIGLAINDYRAFQADLFTYVDGLLGPLDGLRVLEVGPGPGFDTARLARRGAAVWAIDVSQVSLELVRGRCAQLGLAGRVHPIRMNAEQLAFPDEAFDLTYTQNALVHTDWPRVVSECFRVLRPGGRALFVEPLRDHPAVALYRATLSHCRGSRPRYLSWWDFGRIGHSFRRGCVRSFYFLSPLSLALRPTRLEPLLRTALQALDQALLRLPFLRPFAWYIVAVFEK